MAGATDNMDQGPEAADAATSQHLGPHSAATVTEKNGSSCSQEGQKDARPNS